MKYIIYPDVMLLWVSLINYLTYYMTCRITLRYIRKVKLICWSILTAIILVSCYIALLGNNSYARSTLYIYVNILLELIFITRLLKLTCIRGILKLLAYNSYSFIMLAGIMKIFCNEKPLIKNILPIALIICLIFPWIRYPSKEKETRLIYSIRFQITNHVISAKGYIDTGNNLIDLHTGSPVIIINHSLIKDIISNHDYEKIKKYMSTKDYTHLSELLIDGQRIYPVYYQTISSNKAILPCFKLKRLILNNHLYDNVVAGISPEEFGKDLDYNVLLNNKL